MGLEQIEIVRGQGREKAVANRCLLKVGHGSLPHWGKSASPPKPSPSRLRPRASASDTSNMGVSKGRYNLLTHPSRSFMITHIVPSKTVGFQTKLVGELFPWLISGASCRLPQALL